MTLKQMSLNQLADFALRVGLRGIGKPIDQWLRYQAIYDRIDAIWRKRFEEISNGGIDAAK